MNPIPTLSLKTYLNIAIGIVILGLCLYCKVLNEHNDHLLEQNASLKTAYDQKVVDLNQCSNGVDNLKKREDEISKNSQKAVEEAKKKAVDDYKAANAYLFRKPQAPVITTDNAKNYGGLDKEVQLKDYLSSQDLMNEFIDKRDKK